MGLCDTSGERPHILYISAAKGCPHTPPLDPSSLTRARPRLCEKHISPLFHKRPSRSHRAPARASPGIAQVVVETPLHRKKSSRIPPTGSSTSESTNSSIIPPTRRARSATGTSVVPPTPPPSSAATIPSISVHAPPARAQTPAHRSRRIIRDIRRQIDGDPALEDRFGPLLDLALRVRHQEQRQRGPKVYSLHAPEVECIGKGKARTPYEFGCKVSIVTPVTAPKGGQFVLHAKALHGNPYDGHTLGPVIADLEKLTGAAVRRIHGDKGYRGHSYPDRFRVWISGQVRRVTKAIRREMRRRAAVEPVIGHLKDDHRMRRNYLKGRDGDRINAVLAAAGYNFSLLRRWFEDFLCVLLSILRHSWTFFTDDSD